MKVLTVLEMITNVRKSLDVLEMITNVRVL